MKRRLFLQSLAATSVIKATPSWAEMGSPLAVGAAQNAASEMLFCGMGPQGQILFQTPMPVRGHAAAIHPNRAEAVAPARRPGDKALVIDLSNGEVKSEISLHDGHFYGHGAYDQAGEFLYTTENDLATSQGRIGIWDALAGYKRVGAVPTGGIGPHEILELPWGGYAVANGGILTDPSAGRAKLNIPTMKPSLSLFDDEFKMIGQYELPAALHQLSIRHLAASQGRIAIGLQWEGDARERQPVIAIYRDGEISIVERTAEIAGNYIGSVAVNGEGNAFGFSAPKSNLLIVTDLDGTITHQYEAEELYGLAPAKRGFVATADKDIWFFDGENATRHQTRLEWDNHLKAV